MKIKVLILAMIALWSLGVTAQNTDLQNAERVIKKLKENQIDSILLNAGNQLNKKVLTQIREAIVYNGWEYYSGPYTTEKYKGLGSYDQAVYTTGSVFRIALLYKDHKLAQCYIEPGRGPDNPKFYHLPAYNDTTRYENLNFVMQNGIFNLPGTVTLPKGKTKFPLLIYVHGSGSNGRDEGLNNMVKPFQDIAIGLANAGIASLRYDKRNKIYGKASVEDGDFNTVSTETVDDVSAAIKLAKEIPGVDIARIFILGHSQGGMMLPEILKLHHDIAGGIFLSAPSIPLLTSYENQYHNSPMEANTKEAGLRDIEMIKNIDNVKDDHQMLLIQPAGFWRDIKNYDQLKIVKGLKLPLLFLQGGRDFQVAPENLADWKQAILENKRAVFKSYPKLNHFYTEGEGPASGQDYNHAGNVPEYVINDIENWILQYKSNSNRK